MEHNAISQLLGWIPLFPLLGFLVNGLVGKRLPMKVSGILASLAIGANTFDIIKLITIILNNEALPFE